MKENGHRAEWPYEDIVGLPHHVSRKHPQMSMIRRAAQFAPFAALTGYGDAVDETARITDEMIALSDESLEELDQKISDAVYLKHKVIITYFVPDEKKTGGAYVDVAGVIRKTGRGEIILENGLHIPGDRVTDIRECNE